jgi:xylan 1,4-beta-xylosidase
MSKEDIDYLNGVSKPKISVDYIDIDNIYLKTLHIPVHGAELVILEKQL